MRILKLQLKYLSTIYLILLKLLLLIKKKLDKYLKKTLAI
jgi:hypothetical protein